MTAIPRTLVAHTGPPPADTRGPALEGARGDRIDEIYASHFAFVFRTARRLGVPDAALDDAVQDVFLVVHRRRDELRWSSSIETLLFGITLRVAKDHRRATQRRHAHLPEVARPDALDEVRDGDQTGLPDDHLERRQAREILHAVLDQLDDDKRAMLISVELEQMTVPEVAQAMGVKLNTAYTKLRAARQDFDKALARYRASTAEGRRETALTGRPEGGGKP